jgi:hypothetical protein
VNEGPKVTTLPAGVSGEQLAGGPRASIEKAKRQSQKGAKVAQGVKGSGLSVEERKARAREAAKASYWKKRGKGAPPSRAPRRGGVGADPRGGR